MDNKIEEHTVLISLHLHRWTNQYRCDFLRNKAGQAANVTTENDRYTRLYIPKSHLEKVNAAFNKLYSTHCSMSLPWGSGGVRILPSEKILEYTEKMQELHADIEAALSELYANYGNIVEAERAWLSGTALDGVQFPSLEEVKAAYGVDMGFLPFPSNADFRLKVAGETEEMIKQKTTEEIKRNLGDATAWIKKVLSAPLRQFAKKFHEAKGEPIRIRRYASALLNAARNSKALNINNNEWVNKVYDIVTVDETLYDIDKIEGLIREFKDESSVP